MDCLSRLLFLRFQDQIDQRVGLSELRSSAPESRRRDQLSLRQLPRLFRSVAGRVTGNSYRMDPQHNRDVLRISRTEACLTQERACSRVATSRLG